VPQLAVTGAVLLAVVPPVRCCLPLAPDRSPLQDVVFAAQQLVEMAVHALSPGSNDPCMAVWTPRT